MVGQALALNAPGVAGHKIDNSVAVDLVVVAHAGDATREGGVFQLIGLGGHFGPSGPDAPRVEGHGMKARQGIGFSCMAFVAVGLSAHPLAGAPPPRSRISVSPHLYEVDIQLLREIGADDDALELQRKQFRVVLSRCPLSGAILKTIARAKPCICESWQASEPYAEIFNSKRRLGGRGRPDSHATGVEPVALGSESGLVEDSAEPICAATHPGRVASRYGCGRDRGGCGVSWRRLGAGAFGSLAMAPGMPNSLGVFVLVRRSWDGMRSVRV